MSNRSVFFCICIIASLNTAFCAVRLPSLVSDNMVLQRDAKVKIWGWAASGEKVSINFRGRRSSVQASQNGRWEIWLKPMKAGGPYDMVVSGSNTITIKNILIGDVWLCAGQSNMVHYLQLHRERYAKDIDEANYPAIRHVKIPMATNLVSPNDDLPPVQWKSANPNDVLDFSVVAYFFARSLYDRYKVPIGLINASVGGSPIEAWLSEEAVKKFPTTYERLVVNRDTAKVFAQNRRAAVISRELNNTLMKDAGLVAQVKWFDPNYDATKWKPVIIPSYWEDQGVRELDGVVWYRKQFAIQNEIKSGAKICLGRIVDADEVYINGIRVGGTTYQYPQRKYDIPMGVLKQGRNVLVVRVVNYSGKGGFVPDKPYHILTGMDTIDLRGEWHYKIGTVIEGRNEEVQAITLQYQPAALYNGMLAPLQDFAFKGVIWYQGESNTESPAEYDSLLPALIRDWRRTFHNSPLPFIYAQLPNFMEADYLPAESKWARLREAQLKTLSVSNTGMAVTIDLGEWNDIHPGNKKPVGERLALAAMQVAYNAASVPSSPIFHNAIVEGNRIRVTFKNIGTGLTSCDGEPLQHIAVAGADKRFYWAEATIEGASVVVSSPRVAMPLYVRYAWADNPDGANLCNNEGLPASPFRTYNDQ